MNNTLKFKKSKNNLFNNKLKTNTERYISEALAKSGGLNAIISDSNIQEETSGLIYDEKDLDISFAGRGKDIIKNILQLKETIKYLDSKLGEDKKGRMLTNIKKYSK